MLKILYKLNDSFIASFNINAMLLYCYQWISVGFSQVKLMYFKVYYEVRKIRFVFFFMSIPTITRCIKKFEFEKGSRDRNKK